MALNNKKQSNIEVKTTNKKQSYLESQAIEARQTHLIRSDYNKQDVYSDSHEDAISNPDDANKALGKGTNSGGHQHYVPDSTRSSSTYNYNNIDTNNGGGGYDIHGRNEVGGRNRLLNINIYNKNNSYGPDSVDTSANIDEGQYVIKM